MTFFDVDVSGRSSCSNGDALLPSIACELSLCLLHSTQPFGGLELVAVSSFGDKKLSSPGHLRFQIRGTDGIKNRYNPIEAVPFPIAPCLFLSGTLALSLASH
jgi:hypothetical protein